MFAVSPEGADTAEYLYKKPCGLSVVPGTAFRVVKQVDKIIRFYHELNNFVKVNRAPRRRFSNPSGPAGRYFMDLTVMLLIYNEKGNIIPLVEDIFKVYDYNELDGEILLVDDGSTDGSNAICDRLAKQYKRLRTVHHKQNIGRSFAIRTGFQNARGKISIIMDGDRQYDPGEIIKFVEKMTEGWGVVSGNRTNRADKWIRRFISRIYNRWIIGKSLGLEIEDQNSGFKAFITKKAVRMKFDPEGFRGLHRFILPLAKIKGMRFQLNTMIDRKVSPTSGSTPSPSSLTGTFLGLKRSIKKRLWPTRKRKKP